MSETNDLLPGNEDSERRQFFRIDDTVRLGIRPVTAEQMQQGLTELEQGRAGNFTVMSSLAAITAQMSASMRRIEARDPDLAAYLRALDHKLEILGRGFLSQDSDLLSEPAQAVNLSAGGVSLHVPGAMSVGQLVEVRLLLFPSFTGLLTYGDVVSCETLPAGGHDDAYRYQLRIEFSHLHENDREILIRHVLQRQSAELRERRRRLDAGEPAED